MLFLWALSRYVSIQQVVFLADQLLVSKQIKLCSSLALAKQFRLPSDGLRAAAGFHLLSENDNLKHGFKTAQSIT